MKRGRKGSKLYVALVTPRSSAGVKYRHGVAWVSFFSCDDVGPTVCDWGRISPTFIWSRAYYCVPAFNVRTKLKALDLYKLA